MKFLVLLMLIFQMFSGSREANILAIFPHPGYSHFLVFHPIMTGLAENGHTVTVVSYFPLPEHHKNYKELILTGNTHLNSVGVDEVEPTRSLNKMFLEFFELFSDGQDACKTFFHSNVTDVILNSHQKNPFDLLIYEIFDTDCVLGLAHFIPGPVIGVSSCALMPWHYDRIGLLDLPSFIPSEFVGFNERMSMLERFVNFVVTKSLKMLYRRAEQQDNEIILKNLKIDVDVRNIAETRTSLILVNQHYSLSAPRPLSGQLIEIGGVHISNKSEPLSEDLERFLNGAQHGIIYISWGSMVRGSSIEREKVYAIVKALGKLPQRVVWKWEQKDKPSLDKEKFYFSSWFKQKDVLLIFNCETSNILALFSHPGFSHFVVFRPIVEKLAEIGHTVTVVSYFPIKDHQENYREIIIPGQPLLNSVYLTNLNTSRSLYTLYKEFVRLSDRGHNSCRTFYNSSCPEKILKSHQDKPFDLIIYEVFDTDCLLGIAHLLPNVPVIGISSCVLMPWHYDRIGLLDFPSFIPSEFVGFSEKMSYFDRFSNFISTKSLKLLYRFNELRDNELIRQSLKIDVDVGEIAVNRTNLLFVNSHYSIHAARPLMGQIVEILGVHIPTKSEPLTEDLSKFLNESQHGVIFISWGSMVRGSSMTKENFHAIVAALMKFPQRIVWKWEVDQELIKDSSKFFFSSWFPQKDLLCHPKVKMFWSHGGLLGLSEACHCSVPMVVTPIYGDQFLNGKATENRGVGKILPYNDINEESVYQAISQVLKEEYSSNMKQLSKTFRNRQNSPLETAIWWIEHIIETGGDKLLRSASVDMNWFAYYSIDVIFVLIGIVLLVIAFLVKLANCMRNLCCGNNNKRHHPKMKSS